MFITVHGKYMSSSLFMLICVKQEKMKSMIHGLSYLKERNHRIIKTSTENTLENFNTDPCEKL